MATLAVSTPVSRPDPLRDPHVGDCLRKFGAKHNCMYRYVTARTGNWVTFTSGPHVAPRAIWLSSWQNWAESADIEQHGEPDTPVDVVGVRDLMCAFFARVTARDASEIRKVR